MLIHQAVSACDELLKKYKIIMLEVHSIKWLWKNQNLKQDSPNKSLYQRELLEVIRS